MEPLKGCVSGGVNYPLKPVTPGHQDAALTEVQRSEAGLNPLKSITVYTQAHGDGLCTITHKYTDRNSEYWQINDRVNTELRLRWLKKLTQVKCSLCGGKDTLFRHVENQFFLPFRRKLVLCVQLHFLYLPR